MTQELVSFDLFFVSKQNYCSIKYPAWSLNSGSFKYAFFVCSLLKITILAAFDIHQYGVQIRYCTLPTQKGHPIKRWSQRNDYYAMRITTTRDIQLCIYVGTYYNFNLLIIPHMLLITSKTRVK